MARLLLVAGGTTCGSVSQAAIDLSVNAQPVDDVIQVQTLVEDAAGVPSAGLTKQDFAVSLDGNAITDFEFIRPRSRGIDLEASIAFVTGGSDVAGMTSLIQQLPAGDQVSVVRYRLRPSGEFLFLYMSVMPFAEMDDGGANTTAALDILRSNPPYFDRYDFDQWRAQPLAPPLATALDQFETLALPLPAGLRVLVDNTWGLESSPRSDSLINRAIADNIAVFELSDLDNRDPRFLFKEFIARATGGALFALQGMPSGDDALARADKWLNDSYRLLIPATAVTDCDLHVLEISVPGQSTAMPFVRCDAMPDPFYLGEAQDVTQGSTVVSPAVTITGIDSPTEIHVIGGEYSIGCGSTFTQDSGFIQPQDIVCVRHIASVRPLDFTETTLVVGNTSATFDSKTNAEVVRSPPPPPDGGGGPAGIGELLSLLGLLLAWPVAARCARLAHGQ